MKSHTHDGATRHHHGVPSSQEVFLELIMNIKKGKSMSSKSHVMVPHVMILSIQEPYLQKKM